MNTIDLLLTDLLMPGSTGTELASRIKASRPAIKVIYMSGYREPSIASRGLLDSAVTYLQKPFSPEALQPGFARCWGPPK